ncbi:MAG: hypothetical protein K2O68_00895, partial [Mucispirillum sp.]|nr:hypothetical protein [Mucispirillum sp.]
ASLNILADVNKDKKIIRVNLRNCQQESSFSVDKSIRQMIVSEYISAYAVAGGSKLYVYNMQNGKLVKSFDDFLRSVYLISQSDMGQFIAASDGITVGLYQFKKEGLVRLYSKEFSMGIAAVYPDIESNLLYVIERNGRLSVWTFSGKLQKNVTLSNPVTSMIFDDKTGKFLASSNTGLYSISKDDFTMEKILNGKILSVFIENFSSRLEVMTDLGFTVYDYPSMRPVIALDGANGGIIKSDGANFAAFSGLNYIKIYDLKQNIHVGTIAVDSLGVVNFYPPNALYGTNISASFIAAAAGSAVEKQEYNRDKVCAPIAAMVAGIYSPENMDIRKVQIDEVDEIYDVSTPQVKEPAQVNGPQISFKDGSLYVPEVKEVGQVADVNVNDNTIEPNEPNDISSPDVKKVKDIEDLMASKIPSWVANRKNLPKNNAVGNGNTEQEALLAAKLQLKNNIVRQVLGDLVREKEISSVDNIEGKKRILWQAAAKAANSLDNKIFTQDIWVTPAGQYF